MIRDFSKEELLPVRNENDTELTLGAGAFLGLGGGLLLLCGICFGLGYVVGHRSSPDQQAAIAAPLPVSKASVAPAGSGSKPGAGEQARVRPQGQSADIPEEDAGAEPIGQGGSGTPAVPNQPQVKPALEPQVRPALGAQSGGTQAAALQVQSAMKQPSGWMVQIAQVSQTEDAQVLVNALRKRGYTVTARHELTDNLIHVQTGPFVNRNDANAMRQKLLNDGYNAIVQ
jgi:DedD protein